MTSNTYKLLFFTAVVFAFGFFLGGLLSLLAALPILWDVVTAVLAARKLDDKERIEAKLKELEVRISNAVSNMAPRGF